MARRRLGSRNPLYTWLVPRIVAANTQRKYPILDDDSKTVHSWVRCEGGGWQGGTKELLERGGRWAKERERTAFSPPITLKGCVMKHLSVSFRYCLTSRICISLQILPPAVSCVYYTNFPQMLLERVFPAFIYFIFLILICKRRQWMNRSVG